jgi:hypothetical protein
MYLVKSELACLTFPEKRMIFLDKKDGRSSAEVVGIVSWNQKISCTKICLPEATFSLNLAMSQHANTSRLWPRLLYKRGSHVGAVHPA